MWIGPREKDDSNEEWALTYKGVVQQPFEGMDDGVHVNQMLDDLFMLTNFVDQKVEATRLNVDPRFDYLDGIQIVQDVYNVMEELASLPKNIPTNEDVVGNEAIVKDEQSK